MAETGAAGEKSLLAYAPDDQRLVMIEVLENAPNAAGDLLGKLRRRAEVIRQAEHVAFVPVLEVGVDDGLFYAVRECVPGESVQSFVRRASRRLPEWIALDLALQLIDALESLGDPSELQRELDLARSVVAKDFGGRLRLRLDGLELKQRSDAGPESERTGVGTVCEFLHFLFCGRWVPTDHRGRVAPMLGELPESVRFLIWAAFQKGDGQKKAVQSLDELRRALKRIQDGTEARPLPMSCQPVCRLQRHFGGEESFQTLLGHKYHADPDSDRAAQSDFMPLAHERRLRQYPFGYPMRLHIVPSAGAIGDDRYESCLEQLSTPRNVSHRHVLRACDHAEADEQFFVVEEDINGFSLEELATRRGGFDLADARMLARRVHEALGELENSGRWMWSLSAENVLVHFETRLSGDELLAAIERPVDDWPAFKLVMRLYPTMTSLLRGSLLPVPSAALAAPTHAASYLAGLVWRMLSFNPYALRPLTSGSFHPLRRLTEKGNALLRQCIESDPGASAAGAGREAFLASLEQAVAAGELERGDVELPAPLPIPIATAEPLSSYVPSGSDSRRLYEEARERAVAGHGKSGLFARLRIAALHAKKNLNYRKVAFHASMAALIVGLAALTVLFVRTDTRGRMISSLGSLFDSVMGGGERVTAEEVDAPRSQTLSATAAAAGADDAFTPVSYNPSEVAGATPEDSVAPIALATCVPPDDLVEIGSAEKAIAVRAADEAVVMPDAGNTLELLDSLLKALRTAPADVASNEVLLLRAASIGSTEALVLLGDLLKRSDTPRALAFYKRAAVAGHPGGMNAYAHCLWNGIGLAQDRDEALAIYLRAADEGDLEALETLGELSVQGHIPEGTGGYSRLDLLESAAKKGSGKSAASLGVLYLNGLGVRQDPVLAAKYFEQSALAGHVDGMLYFARCLNGGIGTQVNLTASRHWFQKAAKAGNEAAADWCRQNGAFAGG